ncbi:MAG TPA: fluoride efflux transporter CrcB [Acidimicrobiales bacterium]|nr:fluoride efflux transporter CrcB [Acidimicrobiales bacterium]
MTIAGLMIAGAAGAVLRYLVDRYVQGKVASDFPYGTLVINVTGSLVLGFLTGSALHHGLSATWVTVLGTGLIGAYTTFSTFTYDSFRLLGSDGMATALTNILVSVVAGLGAAVAGLALGTLL